MTWLYIQIVSRKKYCKMSAANIKVQQISLNLNTHFKILNNKTTRIRKTLIIIFFLLLANNIFQNTWPCVQLLCAECNAPCQRDLAIDKAKPPASAAKWQGNDQTDLQCQAARHCHHQVKWATCAAWYWGSGPHSEGEKTPMVWTCGTLQWCNQDSFDKQVDGKRGPGRPKMTWKQLTEGLQRVEALGY